MGAYPYQEDDMFEKIVRFFCDKPETIEDTLVITFHKDGRVRTLNNETRFRVKVVELDDGKSIEMYDEN